MTVRWEKVKVGGSPMRIYLGTPDTPGPHPGIVVIQHRGGVDEVIQDMVHRLRREGYVAAAPDLFHRLPEDADPSKRGRMLRDTEIIADVRAAIAHMRALPMAVAPLGIVGFCLGGRVSYLAAATITDFSAAVVFYGGSIMEVRGEGPTPFERTPDIHCPVLGFFGADDDNPSPEHVSKIGAELTRLGKWHEFHSYRDTGHGFHNFLAKERYRERASRGSWHEMVAFFDQYLRGGKSK